MKLVMQMPTKLKLRARNSQVPLFQTAQIQSNLTVLFNHKCFCLLQN